MLMKTTNQYLQLQHVLLITQCTYLNIYQFCLFRLPSLKWVYKKKKNDAVLSRSALLEKRVDFVITAAAAAANVVVVVFVVEGVN